MFNVAMSAEEIGRVLKQTGKFGLRYASFNIDGDFMVEHGIEDQVAACCRSIDKAAHFNPKVLIVFAGWQDRRDEGVYGQVADALKHVARHAAKYHLTVALENHGDLTTTPEQINRILSRVNEPNIGINYDPANFWMYGEDPYRALLALEHPVVFTHFKSGKTVRGQKAYCRLREGAINYRPILHHLAKTYTGFYAIEYEEPSDVLAGSEDDLRMLQDWLKEASNV